MNKSEREIKAKREAVEFESSNMTLEDAYVALGKQLIAVETIDKPTLRGFPTMNELKEKALDFLKKFGENIIKGVCEWWTNNRDLAGKTEALVAGITPIIAVAIPPPWGIITGIVALIVVIIIRAGMDTVCPTGKGKAVLPWMC